MLNMFSFSLLIALVFFSTMQVSAAPENKALKSRKSEKISEMRVYGSLAIIDNEARNLYGLGKYKSAAEKAKLSCKLHDYSPRTLTCTLHALSVVLSGNTRMGLKIATKYCEKKDFYSTACQTKRVIESYIKEKKECDKNPKNCFRLAKIVHDFASVRPIPESQVKLAAALYKKSCLAGSVECEYYFEQLLRDEKFDQVKKLVENRCIKIDEFDNYQYCNAAFAYTVAMLNRVTNPHESITHPNTPETQEIHDRYLRTKAFLQSLFIVACRGGVYQACRHMFSETPEASRSDSAIRVLRTACDEGFQRACLTYESLKKNEDKSGRPRH